MPVTAAVDDLIWRRGQDGDLLPGAFDNRRSGRSGPTRSSRSEPVLPVTGSEDPAPTLDVLWCDTCGRLWIVHHRDLGDIRAAYDLFREQEIWGSRRPAVRDGSLLRGTAPRPRRLRGRGRGPRPTVPMRWGVPVHRAGPRPGRSPLNANVHALRPAVPCLPQPAEPVPGQGEPGNVMRSVRGRSDTRTRPSPASPGSHPGGASGGPGKRRSHPAPAGRRTCDGRARRDPP